MQQLASKSMLLLLIVGLDAAGAQELGQAPDVTVIGRREERAVDLLKGPRPILETPQSIQVIEQRVIREQLPITLSDVVRNVSGVTNATSSGPRSTAGTSSQEIRCASSAPFGLLSGERRDEDYPRASQARRPLEVNVP